MERFRTSLLFNSGALPSPLLDAAKLKAKAPTRTFLSIIIFFNLSFKYFTHAHTLARSFKKLLTER